MRNLLSKAVTIFTVLCLLMSLSAPFAFASEGEIEQSVRGELTTADIETISTETTSEAEPKPQAESENDTVQIQPMTISAATEEVINYPLNSIVVKKTSAVTGELLAGAVFEISQVNPSVSGTSGTIIGRYTTDYTGVVVITGLEPGGYIVKEVQPPKNYLLSENSTQQAWLKPDGTSIVELTFSNYPYGNLLLKKVDGTTNAPLSNAVFFVTTGAGTAVGNSGGYFTTDHTGSILISNLKPGSYVVREETAPQGYILDSSPKTIQIGTDGGTYSLSFTNKPMGGLLVKKYSSVSREPLANAIFRITDINGAVVGTGDGMYTTDHQGQIYIPNLKPGGYKIVETQAPQGYQLNNNIQTIYISDNKIYTLEFMNEPLNSLTISKQDGDSFSPLAGATIKVTKADDTFVAEKTTDASGKIVLTGLSNGFYKVFETKAPNGYVLNGAVKLVNITNGIPAYVEIFNYKLGGIQVSKVDMLNKKVEYIRFIEQLGSNVHFSEDKWICDSLRRSPAENTSSFTLYFSKIPKQHREMVKYFSIIRIINGITIASVKADVNKLIKFFDFWTAKYKSAGLHTCDEFVATGFCQYLEEREYAETTNSNMWRTVSTFFRAMDGWDDTPLKNPFSISPFREQKKFDNKYIPENVVLQLDKIFNSDEIVLHLQCAYWLLRLIPSRISEVLGIHIDCLKRYNRSYVLFIPTWKQNGGRREPIMRSIHLEETGIAGHLIDLIKRQQEASRQLQEHMPDHKKGALLTYQQSRERNGELYFTKQCNVSTKYTIWSMLRKVCVKYNITDNDGQIYNVTSHQFRHNGITDRLAAGFTTAQIAEMTGHHGSVMILNSYNHLNLMPETIIKKQEYLLQDESSRENKHILFGGRILNMEEQLEKRLLRNLRAHRVRGGICSDITGCKSDIWNCLDCKFFVPDADQLNYYEKQALLWREKSVRFSEFPIIKGNAEKNAESYERILKRMNEGECSL